MEKSLKEYQAIIFDMDGTLVDSFSFFRCFKSACQEV